MNAYRGILPLVTLALILWPLFASAAEMPEVGSVAPDFTLPAQDGSKVQLSTLRVTVHGIAAITARLRSSTRFRILASVAADVVFELEVVAADDEDYRGHGEEIAHTQEGISAMPRAWQPFPPPLSIISPCHVPASCRGRSGREPLGMPANSLADAAIRLSIRSSRCCCRSVPEHDGPFPSTKQHATCTRCSCGSNLTPNPHRR
jgi:hypothetical protein